MRSSTLTCLVGSALRGKYCYNDEQAMQGADRKEREQDDVGNEVRRRGRPPVGSSRAVNNRDENRRVIADGMRALLGGVSPCFTLA
jgi:hypothetical protein